MKKLIIFFLVCSNSIKSFVHLKQIKQQFQITKNQKQYDDNIKQFINFYENGAFEKQVYDICKNTFVYFAGFPKNHKSAIIFDIDETILSNYPICKEKNFEWSLDNDVTPWREKAVCPAIGATRQFYKKLLECGFKIIFITSRRATLYNATHKNLIEKGFNKFEKLILMPMDLFQSGMEHGKWKNLVRKEISKNFIIAGSVSDSAKDLEGDNVGYKVKLPNYLY